MKTNNSRWGPVDHDQLRLLGKLPFQKRIRRIIEAQNFAMSIVRGRLRRQFPQMTQQELNLRVLRELYPDDRAMTRLFDKLRGTVPRK